MASIVSFRYQPTVYIRVWLCVIAFGELTTKNWKRTLFDRITHTNLHITAINRHIVREITKTNQKKNIYIHLKDAALILRSLSLPLLYVALCFCWCDSFIALPIHTCGDNMNGDQMNKETKNLLNFYFGWSNLYDLHIFSAFYSRYIVP